MSNLCDLLMILPDLVLVCTVIFPIIAVCVCHIMGCMHYPDFSFQTQGMQLLACWHFSAGAYGLQVWGLSHFCLGCMCKNVLQLSWLFSNLLPLVFLWGYDCAAYVSTVLYDKLTILHYSYDVGISPVVIIIELDYHTICPRSSIFSLDCYCSSCNKTRRMF